MPDADLQYITSDWQTKIGGWQDIFSGRVEPYSFKTGVHELKTEFRHFFQMDVDHCLSTIKHRACFKSAHQHKCTVYMEPHSSAGFHAERATQDSMTGRKKDK